MKSEDNGYVRITLDISGSMPEILSRMSIVNTNNKRLDSCHQHDFHVITDTPAVPNATMRCRACGGEATTITTEPPKPAIDELPPLRPPGSR